MDLVCDLPHNIWEEVRQYVFIVISFLPGDFSLLLRFGDCIFFVSLFQHLEVVF